MFQSSAGPKPGRYVKSAMDREAANVSILGRA